MRCAQTQPAGGPCRRQAAAAVSTGGVLMTLMCAACAREAVRLVPGLVLRWIDRCRPLHGRAS